MNGFSINIPMTPVPKGRKAHNQKASDEDVIGAYAKHGNVWVVAKELGMCGQSIHERLVKLGAIVKPPRFTAYECHIIMEWYALHHGKPMDLEPLVEQLGHKHHKTNICRKARELGVGTDQCREISTGRKKALSDSTADRMQTKGIHSGAAKSGRREDLGGVFFRSTWEANYARYLNKQIDDGEVTSWEYEPRKFVFTNITRGPWCYLPDFLLHYPDGKHEWVEVKGWMDGASRSKIKRFNTQFPDEPIYVLGAKEYKILCDTYSSTIPNWESPAVRPKKAKETP